MKKTNLIGMFAAFALVFGFVACNNGSSSSSSGTDLKEALKDKDLKLAGTWKLTDCSWGEEGSVSDEALAEEIFGKSEKKESEEKMTKEEYIKSVPEKKYATEEEARAAFEATVAQAENFQKMLTAEDDLANEMIKKLPADAKKFDSQKTTGEMTVVLNGDSEITVTTTQNVVYKKGDKELTVTYPENFEVWTKQ